MNHVPETLLGLLQHYSPTGQEAAAVNWLVQRMSYLGFNQAFVDQAGNAVGIKGNGSNQIVLLGHIDTVPGEILLREEEGILHARGAVDAKGPLAAFVDALAGSSVHPDWQVVVIGAVDEEGDSKGARYLVDQYHPQFAIIGEPSQWNRVTLGYKGSQHARLSVKLPLVHSSQGGSASDVLLAAWQALLLKVREYNAGKSMFDQLLPTVLSINSGNDAYATQAQLQVGVRLPVEVSPQGWMEEWLGSLEGVTVEPSLGGISAYKADKNSSLSRAFLGAIRAASGTPGFVSKSGTADINLVAPAWGCPAVAYGPGDSNLDHTPHEHISLEDFARAVQVLQGVLQRLGAANPA